MEQRQRASRTRIRRQTRPPRKSKVIVLNDDVTTFDFVIRMLVEIFFLDTDEARRLTQKIHHEGKATVGSYPTDIAISKAQAGMAMARAEHFPLQIITHNA